LPTNQYDDRLARDPKDSAAIRGKLKCYDALGRWEDAIEMCRQHNDVWGEEMARAQAAGGSAMNASVLQFDEDASPRTSRASSVTERPSSMRDPHPDGGGGAAKKPMLYMSEQIGNNIRDKVTVIGARAAWCLNDWGLMETLVDELHHDNSDACIMRAVLAVQKGDYTKSSIYIEEVRKQQYDQLSGLLAESYSRAYVPLVMLQHCSELEEITDYQIFVKTSMEDASMGRESYAQDGAAAGGSTGGGGGLPTAAAPATGSSAEGDLQTAKEQAALQEVRSISTPRRNSTTYTTIPSHLR
jgi:hypothetical protein